MGDDEDDVLMESKRVSGSAKDSQSPNGLKMSSTYWLNSNNSICKHSMNDPRFSSHCTNFKRVK